MTTSFLCFGELLLRLGAPARELLLQSPRFDVHVGGAEANVAASLAQFGHRVAMASVLPDNLLGTHACGELRRHGVDVRGILRRPGRMGLYFLATGAGVRASEVLYDRAGSAFAQAPADAIDWSALLGGVDWLHLSGVTPALGAVPAQAALRAARAAREHGVRVVFDGNYRATLWQAWEGDAPTLLHGLFALADVAFADARDIALVLGRPFAADHGGFDAAADAAFEAFPHLARIACTRREQHSVDHHTLSACMAARDGGRWRTAGESVSGIVDRIGGGDAFAAGVLHGLATGMADERALRFGLAAACLKHTVPGDINRVDAAQVDAFLAEARFDVRR